MKPYGVRVIEFPCVADIQEMGAKSSCGKFAARCGHSPRGYANGKQKARSRRYWKRKARSEGKRESRSEQE